MKTATLALFIQMSCLASGSFASPAGDDSALHRFATCAGRLSALMEHQWMFDGPASEITKQQRSNVLDLLGAIMPDGRGREVLHWRISAKLAQSALLTRATFNDDPADAAWAAQTATRLTRTCTSLLLGSGPTHIAPSAAFSRNISGSRRADNSGSTFKRRTPLR